MPKRPSSSARATNEKSSTSPASVTLSCESSCRTSLTPGVVRSIAAASAVRSTTQTTSTVPTRLRRTASSTVPLKISSPCSMMPILLHRSASSGRMCEEIRMVLPIRLQLLEQLADLDAGPRVQPAGRLVQQQHLRVVQQHARQADSRCFMPRDSRRPARPLVRQVGQLQHVGHLGAALLAVDVVRRREELQVLLDDHVLVRAEEVRHVADQRADLAALVAHHVIADPRLAPGRLEQGGQDADGRGLARPVGPDEAEALPVLDLQIEVVQRHQLP